MSKLTAASNRCHDRSAMSRLFDGAIIAIALSAGSASIAAENATTPLTRADVIAEMQAARARGELQAGHGYGVDVPEVPCRMASQLVASPAKSL